MNAIAVSYEHCKLNLMHSERIKVKFYLNTKTKITTKCSPFWHSPFLLPLRLCRKSCYFFTKQFDDFEKVDKESLKQEYRAPTWFETGSGNRYTSCGTSVLSSQLSVANEGDISEVYNECMDDQSSLNHVGTHFLHVFNYF